ncbi:MAG: coenzyme F420-0:L-glutamate ligase [Patescibacteria group bacterium]
MQVESFKLPALKPPHADLCEAVFASKIKLKDGDILAIASKVVSIDEGRCIPVEAIDKKILINKEADFITKKKPLRFSPFTITKNVLIRSAGIDESNGNGHYILWPKNPDKSAERLRRIFMKHYGLKKLGIIITDSISSPLRFGAIGFALGFAGFEPVYDYRGSQDIFGRKFKFERANLADGLAAAAVIEMGEGDEKKPVVLIRGVSEKVWQKTKDSKKLRVFLKDDFYYELLKSVKWVKARGK